jgi:predicted phage tail protein
MAIEKTAAVLGAALFWGVVAAALHLPTATIVLSEIGLLLALVGAVQLIRPGGGQPPAREPVGHRAREL